MNKVYKVVWNASLGAWVAVSELAKGKVKGSNNGKVGEVSNLEESNEKSHSETINLKSLSLALITVVTPTLTYAGTEVSGTPTKSGANITNINTCTASATTTNGVAIGCSSIAGAKDSVIADRSNPYNTSTSNSRVTFDTTSGGNTAIGTGASAGNANQGLATAIGTYATANNVAAVAIGAAALSTGNTSLSIGRQSAATADYAQAIGNVAAATGTGALAIGHSATATGYRGIAIGSPDIDNASVVAGQAGAAYQTVGQTKASGRDAIAFGGGSQSLKDEGMTIGAFSGATEQGAAVVGVRGAALGQQSLSIGNGATNVTSGTNAPIQLATSLGQGTITNKTVGSRVFNGSNTVKDTLGGTAGTLTGTVDGVAITINQAAGTGNATTGTVGAITGGSYNGQTLTAEQANALYQSLGHGGSVTLGQRAIAIGTATAALANNALAIGSTSLASGEGSVAIGSGSIATKTDAVSIGRGAGSSVTSGVAIGAEAKVTGDNSIALGQKSVASAQTGSSFLTNVGATTQGTISVGDGTNNVKRRLTNLADGAVDSDGVTVAQLKQFKVITDKQGADTAAALGGGSTYNSTTGAVTTPTYNVGGTTKTNVGDAITNIDNRTTSLENQTWKLNTNSDTAAVVGKDAEVKFIDGKNIKLSRTGTSITIATADSVKFDSVNAGGTVINNNGLSFVQADGTTPVTNSPSISKTGINAGNNKISNVANGAVTSGSKDAVNGGQLQGVADSVKTAIGGNTTIDATTGAITTSNIGGTSSNTIDGAITSVKSTADAAKTTADKGINFGGTTGKNNYALGSDINVKGDSNITSTTVAGGVQLGLANNITIGSGAGTNPVTINGTTGTVSGLTNKAWSGTATSGQAATEDQLKTVSDVANNANKGWKVNTGATTGGTVSGNASTQVSPDQEVKFIAGKNVAITQSGKDITVATSDNPNFTSVSTGNSKLDNSGLVIKDAAGGLNVSKDGVKFVDADGVTQTTNTPSLNKTGINAGNNKISNVANGAITSGSKDAVNGGQLQGVADSVKTAIGGNTTIDATTGAITTSNIGGTGSNTIDGAITSVKATADKGINFGGTTG
ncbi:ESPR-type extended signal peptide-containing protein, partial [Acinetobacter sp. MN12]